MNLKLLRLECDLPVERDCVTTIQIEDRRLFTRVVSALLSEKGQYAEEPYLVFGDGGEVLPTKGALRIVSSLPSMPVLDRALLTKLFRKIRIQLEMNSTDYLSVNDFMSQVNAIIEETASGLQGNYILTKEWDIETYLKSFGFSVMFRDGCLLLDNCISYLGLCADLDPGTPVVLLNAKSFFSVKELNELFDTAVFDGIRLVLMESWPDSRHYEHEKKRVIDQHFLIE